MIFHETSLLHQILPYFDFCSYKTRINWRERKKKMFSNSCNLNFHCLAPKDSGSDSEVLSVHGIKSEPVILNVYDMVRGFARHMLNNCSFVCCLLSVNHVILCCVYISLIVIYVFCGIPVLVERLHYKLGHRSLSFGSWDL